MKELMKGYIVRSVEFYNKIDRETTINISSKVDSTVKYNNDASECDCVLSLIIKNDGDEELISLKVVLESVFTYNNIENKQEIHKEVSRAVFGQAKAIAHALCGTMGIPPFVIPDVDFNNIVEKRIGN